MNDIFTVRGIEPGGNLLRDLDRVTEWNRSAPQPICQRLSLDEFEDQRRDAVPLLDSINRGDVRMINCRQRSRFAIESRESVKIGLEWLRQYFDGDFAPELRIARAIDFAHSAFAQLRENVIGP